MIEHGFGGVHGGVSNPRQSTISMLLAIAQLRHDPPWYNKCQYIILLYVQMAQLVSIGEDTCWEFVSSQKAPLSLETNPTSGLLSGEQYDPEDVIGRFITAISNGISTLTRTEVQCSHACIGHDNEYHFIFYSNSNS